MPSVWIGLRETEVKFTSRHTSMGLFSRHGYRVGRGRSATEEMESLNWAGCFNGIGRCYKEQLWDEKGTLKNLG